MLKPKNFPQRKTSDGYYGKYFRNMDDKNRIDIPSDIERTLVRRNSSLDDSIDPEQVILHLTRNGINCYDGKHYKSVKDKVHRSEVHECRIDLQRRICIPRELTDMYPIKKSVVISASKKGDYFTIQAYSPEK